MSRAFADTAGPEESVSSPDGAILIIEDCEPLLFYLNSALLTLGYKNQLLAASLAEANSAWAQHRSDIAHIILNYELPDGHSFEFAALVHRDRPEVNIVVTSGYDIASIRDASAHTDRYQFLQKPFRLSELKDALETNASVTSAAKAFCT